MFNPKGVVDINFIININNPFSFNDKMELFAEALKDGIAPAIVVAIYLIVTKVIDSRKESIQTKLSTELTNSINLISNYIINISQNIIDKDKAKCKIAIEDAMFASGMKLINFVSNTSLIRPADTLALGNIIKIMANNRKDIITCIA